MFIFFKILKIRDSSLIETFILNLLLKTIRSIFSAVCVTAFPANPYFYLKPGKRDVTVTSFLADVSNLARFPAVRMCQIDGLEGAENLAMIPTQLW